MISRKLVGGVFLVVLALAGSPAVAQCGTYPYFWGYGCGLGGYGCWQPYEYSTANVPYFALHPPVYYSWPPQAHPYGYSPFPNPPCPTAAVEAPASNSASPAGHLPPLRIINPYVH